MEYVQNPLWGLESLSLFGIIAFEKGADMTLLLDMRRIEVSYNGRPAVQDVSLQMNPGEILGIVGQYEQEFS